MGFEMDQETVGSVPVCRFSFQMNFDSVVFDFDEFSTPGLQSIEVRA